MIRFNVNIITCLLSIALACWQTPPLVAQFLSRDSLLKELQTRRSQGLTNDSGYVHLVFMTARNYRPNTAQMRLFVEEVRPIVASLNNKYLQARLYENVGNILRLERRFSVASDTLHLALHTFEALKDSFNIAALSGLIGLMYQQQEMFSTALQYYEREIALGDAMHDNRNSFLARLNVAEISLAMNQPEKAKHFLYAAETYMRRDGRKSFRIEWLKSMASLYRSLEKPDSAYLSAREGVELAWSLRDTLHIVNLLGQEVQALSSLSRFREAIPLIDSLVRFDTLAFGERIRPSVCVLIADALVQAALSNDNALKSKTTSFLDQAFAYTERGLAHPLVRKKEKLELYSVQARIYEAWKRNDEVVAVLRLLVTMKDSIINDNVNTRIIEVQERGRLAEQEAEIQLLTEKNERRTAITILLGVLVLAGVIIVIILVQRSRQQARYEEHLQDLLKKSQDLKEEVESQNASLIENDQIRRALLEEKALLALVADTTSQVVVITDVLGRTKFVNQAFERLTGYSLADMQGKKPGSVLQGKNTNRETVQHISQALQAYQPIECNILNYTKEGREYWLRLAITPVFDDNGSCISFVAIEYDITEELRTQEEERLTTDLTTQSMLDASGDVMTLVSADFKLLRFNKSAYQSMLAMKPDVEPVIGLDVRQYAGQRIADVERDFATVMQGNSLEFDIELPNPFSSESPIFWEISYNPVRNVQGEIVAVCFVAHNITNRRIAQLQIEQMNHWLEERVTVRTQELQEQTVQLSATNNKLSAAYADIEVAQQELWSRHQKLTQLNDQLAESNREKNEIMGIVVHDLKSPLSGIQGLAEVIAGGVENEMAQEVGKQIFNSTERMFALIKNLLELNTIESGALKIHITTIQPKPMLVSIVEVFAYQASSKKITLHTEFPNQDVTVLADEQAFMQVVDNLISNAVKYSPHEKSVFIRLKSSTEAVRVEVQDEGPGISEADMKKMFGKFARLSARPTGGEHSTGLGLSIVKKMVEAMNGRVWCESELGKGATFIVELPRAKG